MPQGSVLGPLLFLIFVNDLPDWIKTNICMFADDTKIWTRITSIKDSADLQKDLDSLSIWSANWQLRFNPDKCKVMHVGHQHKPNYMIHQDNTDWNIQEVTEEKDLGVHTTCTLKVSRQCHEAASKATRVLGMIYRQFKEFLDNLQKLCKTTSGICSTVMEPILERGHALHSSNEPSELSQ